MHFRGAYNQVVVKRIDAVVQLGNWACLLVGKLEHRAKLSAAVGGSRRSSSSASHTETVETARPGLGRATFGIERHGWFSVGILVGPHQ